MLGLDPASELGISAIAVTIVLAFASVFVGRRGDVGSDAGRVDQDREERLAEENASLLRDEIERLRQDKARLQTELTTQKHLLSDARRDARAAKRSIAALKQQLAAAGH